MSCDKKGCRTNTHMVNDSYCMKCRNRMRNRKLKEMGMSDEGDDRMYKYDKEDIRKEMAEIMGEIIRKRLEEDEKKKITYDYQLQDLITISINDAKNKLKEKGWVFCEHANESPSVCPCDDSCICKQEGEMCYNKVNENEIIEDEKLLNDYVHLEIKRATNSLEEIYRCCNTGQGNLEKQNEFNLKLQKAKEAVLERMKKGSQ